MSPHRRKLQFRVLPVSLSTVLFPQSKYNKSKVLGLYKKTWRIKGVWRKINQYRHPFGPFSIYFLRSRGTHYIRKPWTVMMNQSLSITFQPWVTSLSVLYNSESDLYSLTSLRDWQAEKISLEKSSFMQNKRKTKWIKNSVTFKVETGREWRRCKDMKQITL